MHGALAGAHLLGARSQLLAKRNGYAATVTGGDAGATVYVTTLADSGAGSLRTYLTDPAPLWIRFHPSLAGGRITLAAAVAALGDKTIDGRGCPGLVIDQGGGLTWTGHSNIILAYLAVNSTVGSNNSIDGLGFFGSDLIWLHHLTIGDTRDSCADFTGWGPAGQCRVTMDWCRMGPNPGVHDFAIGRTTSPHGNLLGNPNLATQDAPEAGLFTLHHNVWEGVRDRNPFADSSHVHLYSSAVRKWGDVAGLGGGTECKNASQLLVEDCIYDAYYEGEHHLVSGAPVASPDTKGVFRYIIDPPDPDNPEGLVKARRLQLRNGARVGRADPNTLAVVQDLAFDDAVFTPPYAYTPDPAGSVLYNRLLANAGNVPTA